MPVYRFSVYNQMHDVNIFLGEISYYEEDHGQGKRAKDLFSSNQSEPKVGFSQNPRFWLPVGKIETSFTGRLPNYSDIYDVILFKIRNGLLLKYARYRLE